MKISSAKLKTLLTVGENLNIEFKRAVLSGTSRHSKMPVMPVAFAASALTRAGIGRSSHD